MPEICRFYGIIIKMYFDDHAPPHFHAEYAEFEAQFDIRTLALFSGRLPPRAMGLVAEWASLHQPELMELWKVAKASKPLHRLDPLP